MNDLMTKSFVSYVDLKKEALKDLEAGYSDFEMTAMDPNLAQFLEDAEKTKEEMVSIWDILEKLKDTNEESKSLHKPEALKSLREKTNTDISTVLKNARTIRSRIKDMDTGNEANRRLSGYKEGTPIDRVRTSVTNGLRTKLKDLMMDFQELRQKMMSEHREMVGRRYFTVTGEYPEEETIEKIISNGDAGGEEFLKNAIQEHGRGKVLETVVEIQDRHAAAKELERSLLELQQVFLDMAVMVDAQGEDIGTIEHHVMNAAHYVKDGSKNLTTAKEYQRSNKKWMCIGMILLLIIILVIVIPIATSFSHS
ncbi:hypothetical protein GIB67_029258 [Kingdonia uniflora]|uniref:t-SNARE coiled-coil homology domain-containing protein n=1 Tax=Kingdonia uniflora TaxID=39325 RepID=A0A7J7N851_9MAGN|nr:hypothetical protein GIB67_029258 [Kingdonia uniflora]